MIRGYGVPPGMERLDALEENDLQRQCSTFVLASTPISSSSSRRFPVLEVRRSSKEASNARSAYSMDATTKRATLV